MLSEKIKYRYGAMNTRYKKKFTNLHNGLIEILGIPNFKYGYIHSGNYIFDNTGCVLEAKCSRRCFFCASVAGAGQQTFFVNDFYFIGTQDSLRELS